MAYGSRYVLVLHEQFKDYGEQVVKRHKATAVTYKAGCLAELKSDSLLTIISHGTKTYIANKLGRDEFLDAAAMARFLIGDCGLREVQMITLASCNAGKNEIGFASRLHRALGNFEGTPVKTKLNARTGDIVMADGLQFVDTTGLENEEGETFFYRQKLGTKRLYEWDANGEPTSSLVTEGHTPKGLFRVGDCTAVIESVDQD